MEKKDLFKLETRRRIYNFISKYPGLHLRKICREINIPKSTIDYHLKFLKKQDLIYIQKEEKYKRYYASQTVGNFEKDIIAQIRQNIPRKIILYLFLYPEKSCGEISEELEKPPTTITYHLNKLIDYNVLDKNRFKREFVYKIHNQKSIYNLLIKYEKSFLLDDMVVDHLLNWVKNSIPDGIPKRKTHSKSSDVDDVYKMLLEIFPIPYY